MWECTDRAHWFFSTRAGGWMIADDANALHAADSNGLIASVGKHRGKMPHVVNEWQVGDGIAWHIDPSIGIAVPPETNMTPNNNNLITPERVSSSNQSLVLYDQPVSDDRLKLAMSQVETLLLQCEALRSEKLSQQRNFEESLNTIEIQITALNQEKDEAVVMAEETNIQLADRERKLTTSELENNELRSKLNTRDEELSSIRLELQGCRLLVAQAEQREREAESVSVVVQTIDRDLVSPRLMASDSLAKTDSLQQRNRSPSRTSAVLSNRSLPPFKDLFPCAPTSMSRIPSVSNEISSPVSNGKKTVRVVEAFTPMTRTISPPPQSRDSRYCSPVVPQAKPVRTIWLEAPNLPSCCGYFTIQNANISPASWVSPTDFWLIINVDLLGDTRWYVAAGNGEGYAAALSKIKDNTAIIRSESCISVETLPSSVNNWEVCIGGIWRYDPSVRLLPDM